jgi:hypothetical protein
MKLNKNQKISLKVIALFSVAILSTFIGDNFHDFLGDWKCNGRFELIKWYPTDSNEIVKEKTNNCLYNTSFHEPEYHWGYRHYLYLIMCISLFAIQAADIICYIEKKE